MIDILAQDIKYLTGVGPQRQQILNKELDIHCIGDLLDYDPYKYVDRRRCIPSANCRRICPLYS